jgi:hypothetical protein
MPNMAALASRRRRGKLVHCWHREPTITEILSDSIVQALMDADGVDPKMLEAQLRHMARNATAVRGAG